jgi:hypothetical protein
VAAGATVTVTETGKGTSSTYVTDANGAYTAPFLIPGTYEVSVELAGFKKHLRRGIVLQVNQHARVDVTLDVGGLTEATEVTAMAPLTRSDSAEMGEVIEERAVRELPLNGRNFATLVYLAPGITPGQVNENLSGASTFNPRGASNFNALGSQPTPTRGSSTASTRAAGPRATTSSTASCSATCGTCPSAKGAAGPREGSARRCSATGSSAASSRCPPAARSPSSSIPA